MRLIDADFLLSLISDLEVQTGKKCCASAVKTCIDEFFPYVVADCPTIDPETLPVVRRLMEALSKAVAEKEAAEVLLAEYSGVDGCKTIKTCFGYPLDEVQRLVEADKAANLQRAAKGDDSDESAQETARERLP